MRLYRFLNAEYGMKALREKRLRIGRIDELNDDFEFIGIALDLKEERIAIREMRKQMSQMHGVLCMSKDWDSPQMWAHYADSHKGMVLGFDVPDPVYFKVHYVDERPTLASMGLTKFEDMNEEQMGALLRLKAKGWEYEDEYRAYIALQNGVRINGTVHYFLTFDLDLVLRMSLLVHDFRLTGRKSLKR